MSEVEDLRARLDNLIRENERLMKDGPMMERGTTMDGEVWYGTMREVMNDYKLAADAEAREVDRLNVILKDLLNERIA